MDINDAPGKYTKYEQQTLTANDVSAPTERVRFELTECQIQNLRNRVSELESKVAQEMKIILLDR